MHFATVVLATLVGAPDHGQELRLRQTGFVGSPAIVPGDLHGCHVDRDARSQPEPLPTHVAQRVVVQRQRHDVGEGRIRRSLRSAFSVLRLSGRVRRLLLSIAPVQRQPDGGVGDRLDVVNGRRRTRHRRTRGRADRRDDGWCVPRTLRQPGGRRRQKHQRRGQRPPPPITAEALPLCVPSLECRSVYLT